MTDDLTEADKSTLHIWTIYLILALAYVGILRSIILVEVRGHAGSGFLVRRREIYMKQMQYSEGGTTLFK